MESTVTTRVNREPFREWVARLARTLGGIVGAVLLGTLLVTYSPIGLIPPGAVPHGSTNLLVTVALALVIGVPAAFAAVLALGWRESRPGWPAAGFLLGCLVLSGVLVSTMFSTDAGAPLPYFPSYAWWACALIPAIGALAALFVLRRRSGDTPPIQASSR